MRSTPEKEWPQLHVVYKGTAMLRMTLSSNIILTDDLSAQLHETNCHATFLPFKDEVLR